MKRDDQLPYLKLNDSAFSLVFPPYGRELQNMSQWDSHWQEAFSGRHRFWHGFSGGGVLSVPLDIPERERIRLATGHVICSCNSPYGMVLGNKAGHSLSSSVLHAVPDRPPAFAIKWGLAERVPDPTVKVTAEHSDGLDDGQRYLLVVPKANRRSIKMMERLPEWFGPFGVTIDVPSTDVPPALRDAMTDWFGDPTRPMFALPMSGGDANAAWQLAVTYFVAVYWDTQVRGLDSSTS